MKILIKNIMILNMEGNTPYISDIVIHNNIIEKIEKNISEKADKIIDGTNKLLMPGMVNLHAHLGMSAFRTYGENLKLMEWLNDYIFPKEKFLDKEMIYNFSMLSCIEAVKSGTTFISDMYYMQDEIVKVYGDIGLRGIVGSSDSINDKGENVDIFSIIDEKGLISTVRSYCDPHSAYVCDEATLLKHLNKAKEHNTGIQIHLSETEEEGKIIKEKYGKTATKYLRDIGLFEVPVILAHGIYLTKEDIQILKNINGGIVHNPISNAKLASGICDVSRLIKENILVGLGTDGISPTTTLDMFETMRTTAYLQKLKYMDSSIINSKEILEMATINGAKIVNQDNEIGSIKIGKKADVILIDLDKTHLIPKIDIESLVVYGVKADDVETVIINGKIIMENRKMLTVDEKKIQQKCKELATKIIGKDIFD